LGLSCLREQALNLAWYRAGTVACPTGNRQSFVDIIDEWSFHPESSFDCTIEAYGEIIDKFIAHVYNTTKKHTKET
jgi:hypothetical protein